MANSALNGMGTLLVNKAFGRHAEEALKAVADEVERLEGLLSRFIPGSEVGSINKWAGLKQVQLSPETYDVLVRATEFSQASQGLFDITIAPLVDLWDYKNARQAPSNQRIQQILPLVNYADLTLDPGNRTAVMHKVGQSIDLGGIGKGYAGDRTVKIFRDYGVASAFTNIGGNVCALGTKPDGSPWTVGIRHPRQEDCLVGAISVVDKAVVTSGDYQRYFLDDMGVRRHHILDPTTGYPSESGLVSVTVLADSATVADALSTALFVAGMEKGLMLLKKYPEAEAVLIDSALSVHITRGLKNSFISPAKRSIVV